MRSSDKEIKKDLKKLLIKSFNITENRVVEEKTTDLIVKLGDNPDEWLYFEIKSTDKENRQNHYKYFGAISLNQLVEAYKHPGHYFFVIASRNKSGFKYVLTTPEILLSYLTGYYLHADFTIPEVSLEKVYMESKEFINFCKYDLRSGRLFSFPPNDNPKKAKISSLMQFIKG